VAKERGVEKKKTSISANENGHFRKKTKKTEKEG